MKISIWDLFNQFLIITLSSQIQHHHLYRIVSTTTRKIIRQRSKRLVEISIPETCLITKRIFCIDHHQKTTPNHTSNKILLINQGINPNPLYIFRFVKNDSLHISNIANYHCKYRTCCLYISTLPNSNIHCLLGLDCYNRQGINH